MTAEYPRARFVPAHPNRFRAGVVHPRPFELVVIHCTDGHAFAEGTAEMFASEPEPHRAASAHFVVGLDGAGGVPLSRPALVIQCVAVDDVAWHASEVNSVSIGIEHCARTPGALGPNDPGLPVSDVVYTESAKLCAWLLRLGGLPCDRAHVKGHWEASPRDDHPDCPTGCGWDWALYMALVEAEYDALVSACESTDPAASGCSPQPSPKGTP